MAERDSSYFDSVAGERFKQAQKKRVQQLKKYAQYEKHLEKESGRKTKKSPKAKYVTVKVCFAEHIMLLEAAARNDIDEVRELLMDGVDPNAGNEDGLTALHQSCIDNSEDMTRLLIEFGANVNACDSELWTPLHAAATCGHAQLCKYLIDQGADLLAVNGDGNMPFDICEHDTTLHFLELQMSKRGVTQELIEQNRHLPENMMLEDLKYRLETGNSLEFRGRNGETPLHVAATNGYMETAKFLLDQKVSVNVTDHDLWQPIHCAAFWCQLAIVELLLQNGASLDVRTRSGESPVDICEDADAKQRILDMRKEIENNCRGFKSRVFSRERNSSIRGGSVRRSSMKEKKALSMKEAREEGRWLHGRTISNSEDHENDVPADSDKNSADETAKNALNNRPHDSLEKPGGKFHRFSTSRRRGDPSSKLKSILKSSDPGSTVNNGNSGTNNLLSSNHLLLKTPSGDQNETASKVENMSESDHQSAELSDDSVKLCETRVPLISKMNEDDDLKSILINKDVTKCQFNCDVIESPKGCCKTCCIIS